MTICAVDGCSRAVISRGWCDAHYCRWKRYGDVRADVPLRAPRSQVKDCGTTAAYRRGCRCEACREANREQKRANYQPATRPAGPVIRHVETLIGSGMSRRQLALRSGVPYTTVVYLLDRGPEGRVFPETADALLRIEVDPVGGLYRQACQDCGEPPLSGGRWCLPCFNARTLPQSRRELDEIARRRQVAAERRKYRARARKEAAA